MKILLLILISICSVQCAKADKFDTDSGVPDVEGTYLCDTGCTGDCEFDDSIEIFQDDDILTFRTDSHGNYLADLADDGTITIDGDDDVACDGEIIDDTLTYTCTINDIDCQEVSYILE